MQKKKKHKFWSNKNQIKGKRDQSLETNEAKVQIHNLQLYSNILFKL